MNPNGSLTTDFDGSQVALEWQAFVPTGVTKPAKAGYVVYRDKKILARLKLAMKSYVDTTVASGKSYIYTIMFHSS